MPAPDALARRVRAARRKPLFSPDALPAVELGPAEIETYLPHRVPMRLVDAVHGFDRETGRAFGRRFVAANDRGFDGHFPGHPIYPGVLQVESIGQLALLAAALRRAASGPSPVRLTRVIEAAFLAEVGPQTAVTILCEPVDDDGYVLTSIGQWLVGSAIVCACAFEAMWVE